MNISTATYTSPYASQYYQSTGNSSKGQNNTHTFEEQITSAPTTTANKQKENKELIQQSKDTSSENLTENTPSPFISYEGIYHRSTTAQGSKISIDEKISTDSEISTLYNVDFERSNGQKINLSLKNDATISENEDGSISVYSAENNITTHYNADGSTKEEAGNSLKQNANITIINIAGSEVTTDSENATIFNFSNNAKISTGNGNYNIYVDSKNAHINLGDGNTYIYADKLKNGSITGGSGNTKIEANSLHNTSINLGDGDNTVDIFEITNSTIHLGNGDNVLESDKLSATSLNVGDGDNRLGIYAVHDSAINVGNGDNYLNWSLSDNSHIALGNGNNMINVARLENSNVSAGSGENTYSNNYIEITDYGITAIEDGRTVNSTISLGNGNNTINLISLENSTLSLGNGNNTTSSLFIDASAINLGNGFNEMYVLNMHNSTLHTASDLLFEALTVHNSTIHNEHGNTQIDVYEMENTSLELGNSDNSVVALYFRNSTANFGDGDNYFEAHTVSGTSQINMKDGDNRLKIDYVKDSASITLGSGENLYAINSTGEHATVSINNEIQSNVPTQPHTSDAVLTAENFALVHRKYMGRSDALARTILSHNESIVAYHKENTESMRGYSFIDSHNAHIAKQQNQLSNLVFA